jgi:5-methylcytosine-specific restriction protein A
MPSLYNDHTWRKVSRMQRQRQPLCEQCLQAGRLTAAELVHHKVPITKATRHLMYDISILQSLCRQCHEGVHGRARSYSHDIGIDGLPLDPRHPAYNRGKVGRGPSQRR